MEPKYGVLVVELKDVIPRRNSLLPNLYVGITTMDLVRRTELLNKGKGPSWLKDNVTLLRHEFSTAPSLTSHDSAKDLKKSLINYLKSEGYTVNRNTDIWTVYVIELDSTATKTPGKGFVYVGETKKNPEVRLQEHLSRATNGKTKLFSSVVAKHGIRLRMDLAPTRRCFDSTSSKKAESEWAEHLRAMGYTVKGGH